jgi:hypothetical protein
LLIDVEDETDVAARIPYSVQRQAIDMRHLLGRSKEEIKLVEEEMNRVFLYYQDEERKVSTWIEQLSSDNNNSYTIGSISKKDLILISVVLILARLEFGSNLNSSYTSQIGI